MTDRHTATLHCRDDGKKWCWCCDWTQHLKSHTTNENILNPRHRLAQTFPCCQTLSHEAKSQPGQSPASGGAPLQPRRTLAPTSHRGPRDSLSGAPVEGSQKEREGHDTMMSGKNPLTLMMDLLPSVTFLPASFLGRHLSLPRTSQVLPMKS